MADEYSRLYAITHGLHARALVVAEAMGGDTEQLCELLGMWHDAGGLTPEEKAVVQTAYENMQPPSDGLLGTAVSYPLTLPGLNGMVIHLQSVE